MARRLRIQYSDAIYHVMARGNGRQDIVQDDADRGRLVACLERAVERNLTVDLPSLVSSPLAAALFPCLLGEAGRSDCAD